MRAWTDYPFTELGDIPNTEAPVREVSVVAYDMDKYVLLAVPGVKELIGVKRCYVYEKPGILGEVPKFDVTLVPAVAVPEWLRLIKRHQQ
jgi:hypothetical protein